MRISRTSLNLPNINITKFVSRLVIIVLTALLIFGIPFQMPIAKADTWRGRTPFCAGECLPGEQVVKKSNCGNGAKYCVVTQNLRVRRNKQRLAATE
jgi:hypothetical protein